MKVLAAYIASSVCFWLGHFTSVLMRADCLFFLYPIYNRLMCWSVDAEDWAGIEYMWGEKWATDDP